MGQYNNEDSRALEISFEENKHPLRYLASNTNFRETLQHELTHHINNVRSKYKEWRSIGGSKEYDADSQYYADSTEEVQARLIPIIMDIKRSLSVSPGHFGHLQPKEKEMMRSVLDDDPATFIANCIRIYSSPLMKCKVSERTKRLYINRFYELFQELKDKFDNEMANEFFEEKLASD